MKIDITGMNAMLVGGIKSYLYQEILDDLPNAKRVRLMTYNIEGKSKNKLYESLHYMSSQVDFKWILNMPSRCEDPQYYDWYNNRKKFKKDLENTINIIESKDFKCPVHVAVNRNNHSKIFGTENILYVGSQNFSGASQNNYEVGVIIRDKQCIEKVYKDFFDVVYNADDSIKNYQVYGKEADNFIWITMIKVDRVIDLIINLISEEFAELYDSGETSKIWNGLKQEFDNLENQIELLEQEDVDEQVLDILYRVSTVYEKLKNDRGIEELLYYNYEDALAEEEEIVKDTCDEWAAKRDENVQESFYELFKSLGEKSYIDELDSILNDVNIFLKNKGNNIFKNKLDNTLK